MTCFEGERWYTWKRLRLHTWVFSYFPKERLVTIAGLSSLSTRYCGGLFVSEDHLKAEYLSIFVDTHGNICCHIKWKPWCLIRWSVVHDILRNVGSCKRKIFILSKLECDEHLFEWINLQYIKRKISTWMWRAGMDGILEGPLLHPLHSLKKYS